MSSSRPTPGAHSSRSARESARAAEERVHGQLSADDRETLSALLRALAFPED